MRRRHPRPDDFLNIPTIFLTSSTELGVFVYRYAKPELNIDYVLDGDVPEWEFWNPYQERRRHFSVYVEPKRIEKTVSRPKPRKVAVLPPRPFPPSKYRTVFPPFKYSTGLTVPVVKRPEPTPEEFLTRHLPCKDHGLILQNHKEDRENWRLVCPTCNLFTTFQWYYKTDIVETFNRCLTKLTSR